MGHIFSAKHCVKFNSKRPYEVSAVFSILQLKKSRHREAKWLAQVTLLLSGTVGIQIQVAWWQSPPRVPSSHCRPFSSQLFSRGRPRLITLQPLLRPIWPSLWQPLIGPQLLATISCPTLWALSPYGCRGRLRGLSTALCFPKHAWHQDITVIPFQLWKPN